MDFRQKKSIEYDLINEVKRDSINYTTSNHLDGEFKSEILYIIHSTPYLITKDLFHSDEIKLFANFEDNKLAAENTLNRIETSNTTVEKQLSSFKSELDEKIDTVKSLKETLDKQETAFNFVGLYKGFNSLAKRKQKESTNSFTFLVILSFALIIFPIYGMITVYSPSSDINKYTPLNHLLAFLPLISLELILIYFFRVVLHNYKSIQAQILQIELRQTLCQFIQNYADYSKEIKKDDPTALDKFENLIFSGIINDAQNLPSTFDGMDQIGKLLSSLKSKG